MEPCSACPLPPFPGLGGEFGICPSAAAAAAGGKRPPVSFEEVAVFFTEEEWALLDPDQRKLFWEVMEENYETVAFLGDYVSQKDLRAPERSTLPFPGVQGAVFPQDGDENSRDMLFPRASLLSCSPWLEGELGLCSSAGQRSPASFQGVAVFVTEEEAALLNPGQKKIYWNVTEENFEAAACPVSGVWETESEKEPGRGVMEKDNSLQVEARYGDPVVPKRCRRRKTEPKQKQRKALVACQSRNQPEVSAQDETGKRKRRSNGAVNKKRFNCKFSDKIDHNANQKIPTGEKPYKCLECGKCFSRSRLLRKHQKIHTGDKPYKCLECEEYFPDNIHLTAHQKIHAGEKPYKCLECGTCFSRNYHLSTHQKIHTGEKPYKCLECGKCFSQSSHLRRHQKIHTGEKQYKCLECGKCFSQSSHLRTHEKVHTGEKPYKCLECGKCFPLNGSLTSHKKVHTGEKPYKCLECGKCFTHCFHLRRHQKVHTGEAI